MIIGNGDIGTAIKESGIDHDNVLFFASGVSNSSETTKDVYQRECLLLDSFVEHIHGVYFSSLCIYYSDSTYAQHKRTMEMKFRNRFDTSTIVRIGNITWGSNKNTIINWFKLCYQKGVQPDLQNAYRHIISKDEFIYWLKLIEPGKTDIMNIPGEMVHVKEIWRRVQDGKY